MPELSLAQNPEVMIISCSDSRVDPAAIFGVPCGVLFAVRNVANLVPSYHPSDSTLHGVMSALEYGVKILGVSHIIVLGHSHCGGIEAVVNTALGNEFPETEFIGPWLMTADVACNEVISNLKDDGTRDITEIARVVEQCSVYHSLKNLRSYSWILEPVKTGAIELHGWWFDLKTGHLWEVDPDTGDFHLL